MQSLCICEERLSYKSTAIYAPGSVAFMAFVFMALAVFQSNTIFQFVGFLTAAFASSWVAALFFEIVTFELIHKENTASFSRTTLLCFRPISDLKFFYLSDLNGLWVERFNTYSSRLSVRFITEWVPLTFTYSATPDVKKIEVPIHLWLKAHGLVFVSGTGNLPS